MKVDITFDNQAQVADLLRMVQEALSDATFVRGQEMDEAPLEREEYIREAWAPVITAYERMSELLGGTI